MSVPQPNDFQFMLAALDEDATAARDLVHAQAVAQTEHLEIAAYDSLRALADACGEEEAGALLQELLEQEQHALELAERALRREASVYAFPFDFAGPVEKALSETRPGLIVLTETEIWPLFLERAARRGIPVALVNGRISERSFGRYRIAGRFLAKTLSRLSMAAMQSKEDARRLEALGAPAVEPGAELIGSERGAAELAGETEELIARLAE